MPERQPRRPAVPSNKLDAVFSAVSHPARRQILASLCARNAIMTAGEVAGRFKHSWPTTTRHLGVLEEARLLTVKKEGRHRLYELRPDDLRRAAEWLLDLAHRVERADPSRPGWANLPYGTMRNATPPQ